MISVSRGDVVLVDSAVQAQNLLTIDRSFIRRKIGSLPTGTMSDVDRCLKAALALT